MHCSGTRCYRQIVLGPGKLFRLWSQTHFVLVKTLALSVLCSQNFVRRNPATTFSAKIALGRPLLWWRPMQTGHKTGERTIDRLQAFAANRITILGAHGPPLDQPSRQQHFYVLGNGGLGQRQTKGDIGATTLAGAIFRKNAQNIKARRMAKRPKHLRQFIVRQMCLLCLFHRNITIKEFPRCGNPNCPRLARPVRRDRSGWARRTPGRDR